MVENSNLHSFSRLEIVQKLLTNLGTKIAKLGLHYNLLVNPYIPIFADNGAIIAKILEIKLLKRSQIHLFNPN